MYLYILVLPGILLAMYAQFKVKSAYSKGSRIASSTGMTGAQAARRLLDSQRLQNVGVELVPGALSDHYDPRTKVVRLSSEVYHGHSVAALGIAAHEVGHAIQHDTDYVPLVIRHKLVPVANLGSNLAFPLILLGFFLQFPDLLGFGVLAFSLAVLFQIVTLPVEFNASSRALDLLTAQGVLMRSEVGETKKVLSAAALTYVASTLVAILELLRYVLMFSGMRSDD